MSLRGSGAQIAGEGYTLTCQVTEGWTTTTTYRWFRNDVLLDASLIQKRGSISTLSFTPLIETSSGIYYCEVTKSSMTVRSESVGLITIGKFKLSHSN